MLGSKLFFAGDAIGVWEITIECKSEIGGEGVDGLVKALDGFAAGRNLIESKVQLCQVLKFQCDVKFSEFCRRQPELSAGQSKVAELVAFLQMAKVTVDGFREPAITDARFEIAPDVIDVHGLSP